MKYILDDGTEVTKQDIIDAHLAGVAVLIHRRASPAAPVTTSLQTDGVHCAFRELPGERIWVTKPMINLWSSVPESISVCLAVAARDELPLARSAVSTKDVGEIIDVLGLCIERMCGPRGAWNTDVKQRAVNIIDKLTKVRGIP